ncbi:hypothetical protein AMTRI_Chr12g267100 [Amborella trichopoda]|uniref:Nucleoside diphosphate kinase n=1 Tax=Amborella trichopoda TaxID=13333 RepID=W1NR71_AMBTC|nr:probable nucleoside diphosphate kinase 5 [Amborella trichopoda]ERM99451.1 hypothetical protein AMTR_s00131p00102730 [Amborella trichopoda]|eukprot:XP_006836598.1 probable nucleoside diphosphate kinase 5 [Amborella trichopoda]
MRGQSLRILLFITASTLTLINRTSCDTEPKPGRTLAIIKPDGVSGGYNNIIHTVIIDSGFKVITMKSTQLNESQATNFYVEHQNRIFFPNLIKYMTSGPVVIMVLEKPNAIAEWRALIGPTDASEAKKSHPSSIRAMCGNDKERNCVHGSDSPDSAAREIEFFFGKTYVMANYSSYDQETTIGSSEGEISSSHDEL